MTEQVQLDLKDVGFTLMSDEKTIQEIDEIREDAIKAAQATKKFAWR